MTEAKFSKLEGADINKNNQLLICRLCPHTCRISEGRTGFCGVRSNYNGKLIAESYGKISSIALDPIEKKPLNFFMPGSMILSVGSYGCNFRCAYCQNYTISIEPVFEENSSSLSTQSISPEQLAQLAVHHVKNGNIGLAYTYNEPLISYEYVYDCSVQIKERGLKNVVVTNGYISEEPLRELLPLIDAMNIDLKAFSQNFYKNIRGELESVKKTIEIASKATHVEITTLVIPGLNDSADEMEELSAWLASVDPDIPLHITRFYPRYMMSDSYPTPAETILNLREVARKNLSRVI